jgi:hypothetical protein
MEAKDPEKDPSPTLCVVGPSTQPWSVICFGHVAAAEVGHPDDDADQRHRVGGITLICVLPISTQNVSRAL